MRAQFPTLSKEARQLLEIIVGNTGIDGSSLMRSYGISSAELLVKPIRELQSHELIEVGGYVSPDAFPFARFAVRPSAKEYLYDVLKRTPG